MIFKHILTSKIIKRNKILAWPTWHSKKRLKRNKTPCSHELTLPNTLVVEAAAEVAEVVEVVVAAVAVVLVVLAPPNKVFWPPKTDVWPVPPKVEVVEVVDDGAKAVEDADDEPPKTEGEPPNTDEVVDVADLVAAVFPINQFPEIIRY